MDQENNIAKEAQVKEKKTSLQPPKKIDSKIGKEVEAIINSDVTDIEKIKAGVDGMRRALTEKKMPRFRDYWEARRLTLPIFSKVTESPERAELWQSFVQLGTEERTLKEQLQEMTKPMIKEMTEAIEIVRADLERADDHMQGILPVEIPEICRLLESSKYIELQRALSFYNLLASRLITLRKSALELEVLPSDRATLLDRIKRHGDIVFPKRKEMTEEISKLFTEDVKKFVAANFVDERPKGNFRNLREEIQAMQAIAKVFALSSKAFRETQKLLSKCWDQVRAADKQRRDKIEENKEVYQEGLEAVREKVKRLQERCQDAGVSDEEVMKLTKEISAFMRTQTLGPRERDTLRKEIDAARAPFTEREKAKSDALKKSLDQKLKQEEQRITSVKAGLEEVIKQIDTMELEEANKRLKQGPDTIDKLPLTDVEKCQWLCIYHNALLAVMDKENASLERRNQALEELYALDENLDKMKKGAISLTLEQQFELQGMIDEVDEIIKKANSAYDKASTAKGS